MTPSEIARLRESRVIGGDVSTALAIDHTNASPIAMFCGFSSEISSASGLMIETVGSSPAAASM